MQSIVGAFFVQDLVLHKYPELVCEPKGYSYQINPGNVKINKMFDNPLTLPLTVFGFVWKQFLAWGWLVAPVILAPILWKAWLYYIRIRTMRRFKWIMLELRIPPDVEKTPLAMEQVFAIIHSTLFPGAWWKRNIEGRVQEWVRFVMVSF